MIPLGDGEVILVVEDNKRVLEVTLQRVEALGYVAEPARSGSDAVDLLKSGLRPDLILSDILMPGMTGFELARWVRSQMPAAKIMLTTGFAGKASRENRVNLDAAILYKPYTQEQLAKALAAALGNSPPLANQAHETSAAKT